ncbi:MAG: PQQ-dependent sugar dehydrogenase, partial [Propionibacteriaceae bacterium]|nr:PQQ-dependent sugar dehydrogenase [Propionibacteriaceae bacterium]
MVRNRRWIAVGLVLVLIVLGGAGGRLSAGRAYQATPVAGDPATRTRLPGQYAFYPSQVAQPGGDLPGDPQVQLVKVAEGLADPVNVAAPNDASGRIFVVERAGTIRIVDANGQLLPEPFLDLTDPQGANAVMYAFLEQGLLGLTFHPDFKNNGLFYTNSTNLLRSGDLVTAQYKVSADNPNKADPNSVIFISTRAEPYPNHLGGDIAFGPDGYLYIGHGDGGLEGDPLDAGQRLDTHLGKMLRIDVAPAVALALGQGGTGAVVGGKAYGIPADNPFAQGDIPINLFGRQGDEAEDAFARLHPTALPEIWAFGLRNPWQFSFDRQTGDLWIGDVGQNFWEEIDMEPAGSGGGWNYGWKFLQGAHCFPNSMEPNCPKVGVLPVAEYAHTDQEAGGCTVIAMGVYRGQESPSLNGIHFNSDFCSGRIWGVARDEAGTWQYQELLDTSLFATGAGESESGEIYLTTCVCGYAEATGQTSRDGFLWKLVAADKVAAGAETAPLEPAAGATTGATPPGGPG